MNERETVGRRYVEHLTDRDLLTLAGGRSEQARVLRRAPALILDLLDRPGVADLVLTTQGKEAGRFSYLSPFLVFAAAVHQASSTLVGRSYVPDRVGPRSLVLVFDGPVLAAFAAQPRHRLFLAELLASYSRVASGVMWQRGGRRQRWHELDLSRLAALLEAVSAAEQPGVWRRIGDGALFLAGVFHEYAQRSLGLVEVARLQRATGLRLAAPSSDVGLLLEEVAGGAYDRAGADVPRAVVETPRLARRVLTLVAERYLFPAAGDWLPAPVSKA